VRSFRERGFGGESLDGVADTPLREWIRSQAPAGVD